MHHTFTRAAGNPRQTFTDDGSEACVKRSEAAEGVRRTPKGPDTEKHAAGGLAACH